MSFKAKVVVGRKEGEETLLCDPMVDLSYDKKNTRKGRRRVNGTEKEEEEAEEEEEEEEEEKEEEEENSRHFSTLPSRPCVPFNLIASRLRTAFLSLVDSGRIAGSPSDRAAGIYYIPGVRDKNEDMLTPAGRTNDTCDHGLSKTR